MKLKQGENMQDKEYQKEYKMKQCETEARRENFRHRASQIIQNETEEEAARREYSRQRVSQRIQNETEEETDARRRVSQRIQNEAEGETEPIIFYLYLIKF